MIWPTKEKQKRGLGYTLTRTKEFKSSYDSALCSAVPLSLSLLSLPRRENFAFIFSRQKKRKGIGASFCPQLYSAEIAFYMQPQKQQFSILFFFNEKETELINCYLSIRERKRENSIKFLTNQIID